MDLTIVAVYTISDDLLISIGHQEHPQAKMSDAEVMTAALVAAIGSAVASLILKVFWKELPFIDRVGLVFLFCVAAAVLVSLITGGGKDCEKAVDVSGVNFESRPSYNFATVGCVLILVALYITWW